MIKSCRLQIFTGFRTCKINIKNISEKGCFSALARYLLDTFTLNAPIEDFSYFQNNEWKSPFPLISVERDKMFSKIISASA